MSGPRNKQDLAIVKGWEKIKVTRPHVSQWGENRAAVGYLKIPTGVFVIQKLTACVEVV